MKFSKAAFGFFLILLPSILIAYGPRSVTKSGNVVKWEMPVTVHLESDTTVNSKDVLGLVQAGLDQWVNLADSDVTFTVSSLGVAVNADNVCSYLFDQSACPNGPVDDGKNPIVIDEDGTIVAKFFGASAKFTTLGFAAIIASDSSTGEAVKGEAVFNAACLEGVELEGCENLSFTEDDFTSFIVHEMGHFLGLNHSQVNLDEANDNDTSNDAQITTMYPFFIQGNGTNFKTPERDDAVGLAYLYPSSSFSSSTFSVEGTVFDEDGSTEFACANIVVRNTNGGSERTDAISFVSGQLCAGGTFDGDCDGHFEIHGLNPSHSYQISIEPIDRSFRSSSGIPPCEGSTQQPKFDEETRSDSLSAQSGETTCGVNFTLENTSGNVNSEESSSLDIPSHSGSDAVSEGSGSQAFEVKKQSQACKNAKSSSSSSSGSCALIPDC